MKIQFTLNAKDAALFRKWHRKAQEDSARHGEPVPTDTEPEFAAAALLEFLELLERNEHEQP